MRSDSKTYWLSPHYDPPNELRRASQQAA
jgi:hypothetical protein